jgi:hypothetical protein
VLGEKCPQMGQPQCRSVANFAELVSIPSDQPAPFTDKLQLTLAAWLARA